MLNKILIIIYNILVLLLPISLSFKGITYSKLIFLYSILVFIYLILKKKMNIKQILENKTLKYLTIGFLLFEILVIISVVINTIIDKKIIFSNFFEILRIVEYYLIILNYYVLLEKKENKNIFSKSLIILLLANVLLAFFQFHNLFNLNSLYVKIIAPTQYETLVNGYKWPRVVGLVGNPNVFGFLMSLSSCYVLNLLLKNKKKWYYYLVYILLVISLFLTSSRTAYITLITSGLSLIFFQNFRFSWKNVRKTLITISIFLVFHVLILFTLPNSYTWRIKTIFDFNNQNSWQNRVENNKDFLESLKDNSSNKEVDNKKTNIIKKEESDNLINNDTTKKEDNTLIENSDKQDKVKKTRIYTYIIGVGPDKLKEKHEGYFDNEWFMIFFHYGILGILIFLFMFVFPLFSIKKNKKFNYPFYISLILMNFIYMIAAASFHSYLLFGFVCILIAYLLNEDSNNFSLKK